jgi:hypothetical protein
MLKHFKGVLHRIEKDTIKLAILEITINEVVEHLLVSQRELSQKGLPISGIFGAIENFRKILQDNRVKKIANPVMSQKALRSYDYFGEDKLLAYVLMEGNFRAIATQDGALGKRVGDDRHIKCERVWTDLRSQERSKL